MQILKPLIYGVMANADPEAMVVLFAPIGETLWLSPELLATGRSVYIQSAIVKHAGLTNWQANDDNFASFIAILTYILQHDNSKRTSYDILDGSCPDAICSSV